ncbi:MAG: HEAT repeat domain-containing protein [Candidatus Hydrogenedentes bacterium]|nr:HEAT repeat domain-containing protein [Candidatus Hydrogenedentota bacterium]
MTNTTRKAFTMQHMVRYMFAITVAFAVAAGAFAQNAAKGVATPSSATEDECIAALKGDGDWKAKYDACTRLRQVGTEKSIPALASLLKDEKLSHMARYALENMQYPAATDALRKGLGKTKGHQKLGVITSLGEKRDVKSTKAIAKSLKDKDVDVARAAAGALGRIGTVGSNAILAAFAKSAPAELRDAVAEAQLTGAEMLVKDNKGNLAVPFLTALTTDEREYVRLGALRGLAAAAPQDAVALVSKTLTGSDPVAANFAAQIVAEYPGGDMTKPFAAAFPSLPPAAQALLVRGLGDRKDAGGREVVVTALGSNDKAVKLAAATALGNVGNEADVPALSALIASGDAELAAAARTALANVDNKSFDEAIATAVGTSSGAGKAVLVELLSDRMAPKAAATALASLSDSDAAVRIAALRSLTKLGGPAEAPAVVAALKSTADDTERSEAANALNAIAAIHKDAILPAVLDGLKGASTPARLALLRNLGVISSSQALEPVLAAMRDRDAEVSGGAVRVLAEWKSADAAPHLLKLAQGKNAAQKDLALRGYVRLAQAEANAEVKAQMLASAMGVAKAKEEKWLVLPAYGTLATKQSLDSLTAMLDDASIKNEAGNALITAAAAFAKADAANKPTAAAAVQAVLAKCDDANLKERAQKTLDSLK